MNQTDKDFLRAVMHERMTLHYAAAHQKSSSSVQRFAALEEELNKVLSSLTEEQSEVVHQYMEHLFEMSAKSEELYFRCGFLDGYRLRNYLDTLTAD